MRLRAARAERCSASQLAANEIARILRATGLRLRAERKSEFNVTPPSYRFDIAIEEDLVEEVARMHGYDNIPADAPVAAGAMLPAPESRTEVCSVAPAARLRAITRRSSPTVSSTGNGKRIFARTMRPSVLANPIASQYERHALEHDAGSLVDCLKLNLSRQQERVRIFEIGRCFSRNPRGGYAQRCVLAGLVYGGAVAEQWGGPKRRSRLLRCEIAMSRRWQDRERAVRAAHCIRLCIPGRSARVILDGHAPGWLGELHPRLQQKYDLPYAPMVFELNLDALTTRSPSATGIFAPTDGAARHLGRS